MDKKLKILFLIIIFILFSLTEIIHLQNNNVLQAGGFSRGKMIYKQSGMKKEDEGEVPAEEGEGVSIDKGTALPDAAEGSVLYQIEFWDSDGKRHTGVYIPVEINNVRQGSNFGANNSQAGTLVLPAESQVLTGVNYGAAGTEFTGTLTYINQPGTGVRDASSAAVLTNNEFWQQDGHRASGTYYTVTANNVRQGTSYGPNNSITGTITLPSQAQVQKGAAYGANGSEYTGTYGTGKFLPARTGLVTSYYANDDAVKRKGYTGGYTNTDGSWNGSTRFTDNGNNTVTDNVTGLMWTKDANQGYSPWYAAVTNAPKCTTGGYSDWRLPNFTELQSLVDYNTDNPVLPSGHPFQNVQNSFYWTSTTYMNNINLGYLIFMSIGWESVASKTGNAYVIYVR